MNIDLDNLDEIGIYEALDVEGHEDEALNDSYLDLYELLGKEATLKLFKHFRGDKIECPMRLYRAEYIADLAKQTTDRRERYPPTNPPTPKNGAASFLTQLQITTNNSNQLQVQVTPNNSNS